MPGSGIISCSAQFLKALPNAAQIATSAEIWAGEDLQATLSVEASTTVTVSRNNLIRRTASVVLTDPNAGTPQAIVPSTAESFLTPFGNELVLYQGLWLPDGTQELIQVGVFGLTTVVIAGTAADLTITLTGGDRGAACQRAGFADTYTIAPGTNVGAAIQTGLASLQTGLTLTFAFAETSAVTPAAPVVFNIGDDPWASFCKMASDIGYELFPLPSGAIAFLPVPNPLGQPISQTFDATPGNLENTATGMTRTISRDAAFNHIILDGQGSGIAVPVRGEAMDTNPASKTWVGGKYGHQRYYNSSSLYTDQPTVDAAAQAKLLLSLGTIESLETTSLPRPDTEVDDVITATYPDAGLANEDYVLDSFTLSFGTGGLIDSIGRQIANFPAPA